MSSAKDYSGTRLDPALVERYVREGAWSSSPLGSYLRQSVASSPEAIAAAGYLSDERSEFNYRELSHLRDRVRGGFAELGVGPGDVVSVMLPNSIEAAACIWAILDGGSVYSGIPVGYGQREATFMLRRAGTKVLVVPAEFRGTDYLALAAKLRTEAPKLEHVIVVGTNEPGRAGDTVSFDQVASASLAGRVAVEPGALAQLGFTSGTTGEPKAVMNTHQTLDAVLRNWVDHVGRSTLGEPLVNLVVSPVGHHTGFLWGVLLSAALTGRAVFLDRWSPQRALEIIQSESVTAMFGAPTFLQDLLRVTADLPNPTPSLRLVTVAGAPIPREAISVARQRLGCFVCPAWGMTEYGIGISTAPDQPTERIDATDGTPVHGCAIRIVDAATHVPLPPGEVGSLEMTGPGLFLGYFDRPDFTDEDIVDGWFRTGDRAVQDLDGFVTLHGRDKDVIIRGGENIPVIEIENVIYRHAAVEDVAVVGVPDERLGERVCAFVVVRPSWSLDLPELVGHLLDHGLSKHYLPEQLAIVEELPKTASGKIRKVELRQRLDPERLV